MRQRAHVRGPLTPRQRVRVAVAAIAPVGLAALVLLPFAIRGGHGADDVLVGALVYGGLVGLALGFVAVDRAHAWRCPRCGADHGRGAVRCGRCGYDLATRPRYACDERHAVYLDPGTCECGRRLRPVGTARGIAREVVVAVVVGGVLLAFLLIVGVVLRWIET
ncbi:MAG: hypothetical protein KY469_03180 [Actinobacteria bacterium]|nr:hypothetical protein [Actinomycetota bacterium]